MRQTTHPLVWTVGRGIWWSVWNTSHNLGGALIPVIAAYCAQHYGWRYAMFVPGALCIGGGLFLINRLRDIPQSLGLPPIEVFTNETSVEKTRAAASELSFREILYKFVLCNEYIWIAAVAYFFVYIIRIGLNDWGMVYLVKSKGYTAVKAATCILWFEVGGFLGSLAAGWSSDKIFGGKRNPVNMIFILGTLCSLLALHWNPYSWLILDSALIFCAGFFIFGPQMLIGMVAAELTHKKAAATSSGFAGCFAYLGGAIAGGPLGFVIQTWGWDVFFAILLACAITAVSLLLPMWSVKVQPEEASMR